MNIDLIEIIHQLRTARGSNKKQVILRQHQDNPLWKQYLVAVYDTGINYGVSAPGDRTFIQEADVDSMLLQLPKLTERELTGSAARYFAQRCSEEYGELFRIILDGSLRAGVSITTINKVYPNLIPTYPLMLAREVENLRYPLLASTKYDGIRVLTKVENGKATLLTRAGKALHIKSLVCAMEQQDDGIYDGELVWGDGYQSGRTKITGFVNRVLKGGLEDFIGYTYVIFDKISLTEWTAKKGETPFNDRMYSLTEEFQPNSNLLIARQQVVTDDWQVESLFDSHITLGWEGLILRDPEDPYVWKRSNKLIKKKAIHECQLLCTGIEEGTGKFEGMIGSLICEGIVEGKEVKVNLGTGLTDIDRSKLPECYINRTIEGSYNDITLADKSTTYSLFLPRFKRVVGDFNR